MLNDVLHSEDNLQQPRAFLQHFGGGTGFAKAFFHNLNRQHVFWHFWNRQPDPP